MVVLSESYVQNLEQKAIAEALALNLAPTTYRRYVDDTHARFESKGQSREFQKILNKHDRKTLKKIINDFENKTRTTINTTNNSNTNKKQTITVPWIPKIGPKIKKKYKSLDLE